MSITRDHGVIIFMCDGCDDELETGEDDWDMALSQMKVEGWVSRLEANPYRGKPEIWRHYCGDCR